MASDRIETRYGGFASYFDVAPLKEIAQVQTGPFGSQLHKEDYVEDGTPIITVEHLGDNRILHIDLPRVSDSDRDRLSKYSLIEGDIVFSRVGSVDRRALVRKPEAGWLFSGRCLRVRPNRSRVDPEYLSYFFALPAFREYIRAIAVGVTMPSLNTSILEGVEIVFPRDLKEQRAIARALGALDKRIEVNGRMSVSLEAIAHSVFSQWYAELARSVERVPAETLREQGVLEIGDGYRAKNTEMGAPGLPFIRAGNLQGDIDTHGAELLSTASVARAGNKISRTGDVAFTSKGTVGRFSFVTASTPEFVYSPQVCFWRSVNSDAVAPSVLYAWMLTNEFQRQIDAVATQTDMAPYVSLQDQRRMLVPKFPTSQSELARRLDSVFNRRGINLAHARTLSQIRDEVLPELIHGRIRLDSAHRQSQDA